MRVVGLLDRSGYVFEPRGFSRRRLLALTREKDAGALLASLGGRRAASARSADVHGEPRGVAAGHRRRDQRRDRATCCAPRSATASTSCSRTRSRWPESWASYERLLDSDARPGGAALRYEATVGAGLPIIDTYHKLVETGDRVLRIEGCVSGTLMYIVSAVSAGTPVLGSGREAVERGYAEPDPRDDLSGADAARKALILARLLGYRGAVAEAGRPVPRVAEAFRCRSS